MTLTAFAALLDAEPKWVLNTMAALRLRGRYTAELAKRLAVTRAIHEGTGVPLVRSFGLAARALRTDTSAKRPVMLFAEDADVGVAIDVRRILSSFAARVSVLRTTYAPRQRGRPRIRRRDPLRTAAEWGIDVSLLADNLRKTAEQRVRQLDAMASFASAVKRTADVTG